MSRPRATRGGNHRTAGAQKNRRGGRGQPQSAEAEGTQGRKQRRDRQEGCVLAGSSGRASHVCVVALARRGGFLVGSGRPASGARSGAPHRSCCGFGFLSAISGLRVPLLSHTGQKKRQIHTHTYLAVASSNPKGEEAAATRNSPGAPAEYPVERRTVRETGRVGHWVNIRKTTAAHAARDRHHKDLPGTTSS